MMLGAVAVILVSGFGLWAYSSLKISLRSYSRSLAFSIAESGIEYYRWHLAHNRTDFTDGTGQPGPYAHNYYDKDGNLLGQFILDITPPPTGSTIVTIKSTGKVAADSTISKSIKVKLGIPSFAKYAVAANDNMRFGSGTEVFGEIQSNKGIRFDGIAHNVIKSALSTYDDPDHSGVNEFGVHTHTSPVDPLPPAAVPSRTDVFMAGRQFPVPALDFAGITQNLAGLKTQAQTAGYYATGSAAFGYDLVFNTSGTFSLYKVTAPTSPPSGCSGSQSGWGTWSIKTETLVATSTIPANGIIFVEDNLWVRGQIKGARITIASGKFPDNPSTRTSITFNKSFLYTNYDGTDSVGFIAQNNINVGFVSDDVIRIDGALIAQNGRAGRYYYGSSCTTYYVRQTLTSYGMIGSNVRYGFAYTDGTGYQTRNLIYDANLLYGPPPSFPLASDQYVQISWDETQ